LSLSCLLPNLKLVNVSKTSGKYIIDLLKGAGKDEPRHGSTRWLLSAGKIGSCGSIGLNLQPGLPPDGIRCWTHQI
jgi:hypothetical protein